MTADETPPSGGDSSPWKEEAREGAQGRGGEWGPPSSGGGRGGEAAPRPATSAFDAELKRTAFQKKAVSRLAAAEVLDLAIAYFQERGYRAGRTGRPNQVFIMGKGEGSLPRVTGEISARADVGRPGVTLVTLDAAGERLGPTMAAFYQHLRAMGRRASSRD
jgi:hypothetical protein